MPVRRTPKWQVWLGISTWVGITLVLALVVLVGCKSRVQGAGQEREIAASYQFRSLSADIDDGLTVRAAAAAAESALRARGYVITSSETTSDRARIEAKASGDGAFDKMVFDARGTATGTRISLTAEPFGDETRSRTVLDAMLARLGR